LISPDLLQRESSRAITSLLLVGNRVTSWERVSYGQVQSESRHRECAGSYLPSTRLPVLTLVPVLDLFAVFPPFLGVVFPALRAGLTGIAAPEGLPFVLEELPGMDLMPV
jgi:hypothetical protein